jgi:translation initiation factor 3 subunit L
LKQSFFSSQNMVHIAESTVGRRYAGWFINNTERAQRIYDEIRKCPLPAPKSPPQPNAVPDSNAKNTAKVGGQKTPWGGAKVA